MHCKNCSYPLWHLKPGPCPECGTAFKPSDYEFVGNSVRFCCPHCAQAYYGTGERGFLVPREFACVSCGVQVTMDEMILQPTEGVSEELTRSPTLPWVERGTRSWFGAFFVSMGWAMGNPNRTINGVPVESSIKRAVLYAMIHLWVQSLLGGMVLVFAMGMAFGAGIGTGRGQGAWVGIPIAIVVTLAGVFLGFWIWTLTTHVILRITGETPGGLRRTVQAMAYSSGNNVITAMPCVGFYLFWAGGLWWGISAAFMLAKAHSVKGWRAGLAVFLPVALVLATGIGLIGYAIYRTQQFATTTMANMPPSMSFATSLDAAASEMAETIQSSVSMTGTKSYPSHAVKMLASSYSTPHRFLLPKSKTDGMNARVAGHALDEWGWMRMSPAFERDRDLKNAWKTSAPAHRVGDWVFVYEGQDASKPNGRLWVAIAWRDPSVNTLGNPVEVAVVFADGSTDVFAVAKFDAKFKEQNEERALAGLPVIPHPKDVAPLKKVDANGVEVPDPAAVDKNEPADEVDTEEPSPGDAVPTP
jgi:hypothetical protein